MVTSDAKFSFFGIFQDILNYKCMNDPRNNGGKINVPTRGRVLGPSGVPEAPLSGVTNRSGNMYFLYMDWRWGMAMADPCSTGDAAARKQALCVSSKLKVRQYPATHITLPLHNF